MIFDPYRAIPRFMWQCYPTSLAWDAELNRRMDMESVILDGDNMAIIGGLCVWVNDWPHAYGAHVLRNKADLRLPKVSTRKRLRRMVDAERARQNKRG